MLDAACGTGQYFGALVGRTSRLLGIDQPAAMLARAGEKHPDVETREVSLQALEDQRDMEAGFDGVMCIDALEWILRPPVLQVFDRVLRPKGHVYITVEIPGEEERRELAHPPAEGAAQGEIRVKHWYNHFPSAGDVGAWLHEAGFDLELERPTSFTGTSSCASGTDDHTSGGAPGGPATVAAIARCARVVRQGV